MALVFVHSLAWHPASHTQVSEPRQSKSRARSDTMCNLIVPRQSFAHRPIRSRTVGNPRSAVRWHMAESELVSLFKNQSVHAPNRQFDQSTFAARPHQCWS